MRKKIVDKLSEVEKEQTKLTQKDETIPKLFRQRFENNGEGIVFYYKYLGIYHGVRGYPDKVLG